MLIFNNLHHWFPSFPYVSIDILFPLEGKEILNYLQLFAHHWQAIGRLLGLPDNLLEEIHQAHLNATGQPLVLMVVEWLKHQELTPCWGKLVKVLRQLQLEVTANTIVSDHGKLCWSHFVEQSSRCALFEL